MKDEQYDEIESQIGYEFKNRLLLQQALRGKVIRKKRTMAKTMKCWSL